MQKGTDINLARGKGESPIDKFTFWALSTGKVVIVLTETIALMAFLYRFALDRKILDLHDKIKQTSEIVKAQSVNESKYRQLQNTLNAIDTLNKHATQNTYILNNVYAYATSNSVQIQSFSLKSDL